jgi:hypothetical protein
MDDFKELFLISLGVTGIGLGFVLVAYAAKTLLF